MYKLMIADDEPLIRRGIKQLIDLSSLQIEEIYEASTGEEALKVFEEFKPEIVLMDINMPKIDGLSVAKKIKLINPYTKIAIITGYNYFLQCYLVYLLLLFFLILFQFPYLFFPFARNSLILQ